MVEEQLNSHVERHPITLSFLDLGLERSYTEEIGPALLKQIRSATIQSAFLWALGGAIYARFSNASAALAYGVTGVMVGANIFALFLIRRLRSYRQLQVIVLCFTTSAIVASLSLAAGADRFVEYGALSMMLIAVFAFVILQLRFALAAAAALIYLGLFIGFSMAYGGGTGITVVQTFLVSSAILPAALGVRVLESTSRDGFLQRIQISSLRDQVEHLLRRYLSPGVAEVVLADPATSDLGGRLAEVSILFADLEGFTSMAERTDPQSVGAMLNRYFGVVVPTVLEEGGSVMSFGGDAVMAVFNAPNECPDHATRAARASLRIQEAISRLRSEAGFEEAPPFRIGVNTGQVLVGNVGSAELRTFTVIGDAVNIAARLQAHARPGRVLVGPTTFALLDNGIVASAVPPVVLKGISHPVQPYELGVSAVVDPEEDSTSVALGD
jgi:class 3 adenylate cyclase